MEPDTSGKDPVINHAELITAIDRCLDGARGAGFPLQEALNSLGDASYCFVCILMSVPFLQPFSLGPLTMASGLACGVIGWQMMCGHAVPQLPKKMGGLRIHGKGWIAVLLFCKKSLIFLHRFTRPRMQHLVSGSRGIKLTGLLVGIGGILIALPCFNLPLNNTIPALMVFFAAVALLEQDGFLIFVSIFWGVMTVLYFTIVIFLALFFGTQIFTWLHHYLPHWL
ncbi:MAG: exopolysaccharide biosynthesis protein [Chthoniobacterales bacterium]